MTDPDQYQPGDYQRALDADSDGKPDYSVEPITLRTALEAIPRPVRLALYLIYALGGVVAIYLSAKGIIGVDELTLWAGLGSVFGMTAAGNTSAREV